MRTNAAAIVTPWYKQFWPWLIIALPASAVIAGFITLYLAINTPDSLVNDDWYKDGLTINRRMELDNNALALGLSGQLTVDALTSEVLLDIQVKQENYVLPEQLQLDFSHPTLAHNDQHILLKQTVAGHYRGTLEKTLHGKYQLSLSNQASSSQNSASAPTVNTLWRIVQVDSFPLQSAIHLSP